MLPKLSLPFVFSMALVSSMSVMANQDINTARIQNIFSGERISQSDKRELYQLDDSANIWLMDKLKNGVRQEKIKAINLLGIAGCTNAIDAISLFLESDDKTAAFVAAHALGTIGKKECVLPLCEALSLERYELSAAILSSLFKIADDSALESLTVFSSSCDINIPEQRVRKEKAEEIIALIISANKSSESYEALIKSMLESNKTGKEFSWALQRIQESKNHKYIPLLKKVEKNLRAKGNGAAYGQRKKVLRTLKYLGYELTEEESILVPGIIKRGPKRGLPMNSRILNNSTNSTPNIQPLKP
jgi:hypothetical protein